MIVYMATELPVNLGLWFMSWYNQGAEHEIEQEKNEFEAVIKAEEKWGALTGILSNKGSASALSKVLEKSNKTAGDGQGGSQKGNSLIASAAALQSLNKG